ncbi:MAG TPA: hypothetical protein VEL72_01100 [Ktedonobacteraceae bacterium]|nr:hypothetical protein [Ktedonobacteraceae bacterium]
MARPSARFLLARKQDYLLVAIKSQGDRKVRGKIASLRRGKDDVAIKSQGDRKGAPLQYTKAPFSDLPVYCRGAPLRSPWKERWAICDLLTSW